MKLREKLEDWAGLLLAVAILLVLLTYEQLKGKRMNALTKVKCTFCGRMVEVHYRSGGRAFCAYKENGQPSDCLARFQEGESPPVPPPRERRHPKGW